MASWCDPPAPRRRDDRPPRADNWIVLLGCIFACAAIAAYPASGPAEHARVFPPRAGLTAAGPAPSPAAVVSTDGQVSRPGGRRREISLVLAFATGLSILGHVVAEQHHSFPRRRRRRRLEAAYPTEGTEL